MINPQDFLDEMKKHDLGPYIEVPCSLLEPLITKALEDPDVELIYPANEAIAMGIAAGNYMSTNKIPVVMMQNSGLLNTLNALTSLNQIYDIPSLYLITWRGDPSGEKDAPEHVIAGAKLEDILKTFDIEYRVLSIEGYHREIDEIVEKIKESGKPGALVLRKNIIEEYAVERKLSKLPLSRYEAISLIKTGLGDDVTYVSTNGFITRDSFNIKDTPDFYMVGSMGHALPIGIGVAKNTEKKIVVFDGDGGCSMHLGAMASEKPSNLIHIVLDNASYDSTGGQPSISEKIDFAKIAEGCGYNKIYLVKTSEELENIVNNIVKEKGPSFLHVKLNQQKKKPGGRASDKYSCKGIKERFMKKLQS